MNLHTTQLHKEKEYTMIKLQGKGVSKGIAIGKLYFATQLDLNLPFSALESSVEEELASFEFARTKAIEQLGIIGEKTKDRLGEENAALFEVHQMMLDDLDYREAIENEIKNNKASAPYAVSVAAKQFAMIFSEMDDEYMKARALDVQDISRRVIEILLNKQSNENLDEACIYAGPDFTPSETAQFDRERVLGIATAQGSKNSHTAIFARTLSLPAVIGLENTLNEKYNNLIAIIDGIEGTVIIEPDEKTLAEKQAQKKILEEEEAKLEAFRGKKTVTKSGREVKLYANIGTVADVEAVLKSDAEGIGLFRSEFLYLESNDYPTEEVQYKAYSEVAKKMNGKPVIVRTLDIGADKQADYFKLPKEENPAMGMRAIRICLTRPEIFKTQLRAIYRASAHGNIYLMLPMIVSVDEVLRTKAIIEEIKVELKAENKEFNPDIPVGIMIETPAAVMISDLLAKEVDFFSMGTNDLTQYTLAVDRQNDSISEFTDTHHEAILRMIEIVCKNAHANGIWAGICGELAYDMKLTEFFNRIGLDELSVTPSAVLALRQKISES